MMVLYSVNPSITNEALNRLMSESWPNHTPGNYDAILSRSLCYVCAYYQRKLVGYVNVAWDGGIHAFLLDTTVHPDVRRSGIGSELVRRAVETARERGIVWLHVDFEAKDAAFYAHCGFSSTQAGLMRLR